MTSFGALIEKEAKKVYGDDFEFEKVTIEKTLLEFDGEKDTYGWIITFEVIHMESNFTS